MVLEVRDIESGYGNMRVLQGVSLSVSSRSIVALIDPNGSGKTTTLKTIMGLIKPWRGNIVFEGEDITRLKPDEKVELGITLVPEGRRLFPNMTI